MSEEEGKPRRNLVQRLRDEFGFIQGNFLIMILSWLILDLFTELPGTYYALYVEALGATATGIGLIGAIQTIASSIGQLTGGWLYDNVSHEVPFLIQIGLVMIPLLMVYFWIDENEETLY